jgi:hypothetical protein
MAASSLSSCLDDATLEPSTHKPFPASRIQSRFSPLAQVPAFLNCTLQLLEIPHPAAVSELDFHHRIARTIPSTRRSGSK